MSHSPSRHKIEQENARLKAEREFEQAKLDAANKAYALEIIVKFNDRARPDRVPAFFPTIRCVMAADTPVIETVCPGCGMITHTDIRHRKERWHPLATVAMVVAKVQYHVAATMRRLRASPGSGLQALATVDLIPACRNDAAQRTTEMKGEQVRKTVLAARAKRYFERAEWCLQQAADADTPAAKDGWLRLAQHWAKFARKWKQ